MTSRFIVGGTDFPDVIEMPSDMMLEGLYKSKLQNSAQLQTLLALYDQETTRNKGKPNCTILKIAVKLHIDQNSKLEGSERWCGTRISHQESRKKAYVQRKVGECFQWKAHGQCSKGDSCSFSHDTIASGNSGEGQRRTGRGWKRLHAKTVACMEGHAQKCVERYCELTSKRIGQLYKVSDSCPICWKLVRKLLTNYTWHEVDDLASYGRSTSLQDQSQNGLRHVTDD